MDEFLLRRIDASQCRSTHHKLVLDALRRLRHADAPRWRRLLLRHHRPLLAGAKAPDDVFGDYPNHVLHVSRNYWGGAVAAAEAWLEKSRRALADREWTAFAYAVGVLSHYYTDPIQPLHTAQSQAGNNVHRAIEWSIFKCYDDLRHAIETRLHWPEIEIPNTDRWLASMIVAGAERAHRHFQALVDGYNIDLGVNDPRTGLDRTSRRIVAELIAYAVVGFARILDRLLDEADCEPPHASLATPSLLALLGTPFRRIANGVAGAREQAKIERMYFEFCRRERVDKHLPAEVRSVRDSILDSANSPPATTVPPDRASRTLQIRTRHRIPSRAARDRDSSGGRGARSDVPTQRDPTVMTGSRQDPPQDLPRCQLRFHLHLADDVEAAPSIGPRTAKRLNRAGVTTVYDLVHADTEQLAAHLNAGHINAEKIRDWQVQANLVCSIPGLDGPSAEVLVGSGYRNVHQVADSEAAEILAAVQEFAATENGARIFARSTLPELDAVSEWVRLAREVEAFRDNPRDAA